jgi:hypothetical protein
MSHNILDFKLISIEFQIQYEITAGFKKKEMNGRCCHVLSCFVTICPRPKRSNVQIMDITTLFQVGKEANKVYQMQ